MILWAADAACMLCRHCQLEPFSAHLRHAYIKVSPSAEAQLRLSCAFFPSRVDTDASKRSPARQKRPKSSRRAPVLDVKPDGAPNTKLPSSVISALLRDRASLMTERGPQVKRLKSSAPLPPDHVVRFCSNSGGLAVFTIVLPPHLVLSSTSNASGLLPTQQLSN